MPIAPLVFRCIPVALILLAGCASSAGAQKNFIESAKPYISEGSWDKAYRSLEDAFEAPESSTRLAAYDLLVAHPQIQRAATESFSRRSLSKTFSEFDPFSARELELVRLRIYGKFASETEVLQAKSNIESIHEETTRKMRNLTEARALGPDALLVDEAIFDQLLESDQAKFKKMYPMLKVIPTGSTGILRSHQILDRSTSGSNAGSQLGSSIAQAAYVERSFERNNYSALSQLGAGIMGGLIGSAFNTSPQSLYLINYGVELRDGTINSVLKASSDGIASPPGQCVYLNDLQEAPRYLCEDSLWAFIERAKRMGNLGKPAPDRSNEKVSCKLDVVGEIKLDREACRKANGTVVP